MRAFEQRREPGFRCNIADLAMLSASLVASAWLHGQSFGPVAWLPAYVTATFFVFCNVTRIGRLQEGSWAVVAVAACGTALAFDLPFWPWVLSVSLPATVVVVAWARATGRYRGILPPSR